LSLIYGTLITAATISLSPIIVLNAYGHNETQENIRDELSHFRKYCLGGFIVIPKRIITTLMDQTVGTRDFFLTNSPPDGYVTLFIK